MFHVSPQYSGQEWLRRYTYDRRGWLKGLSDEVYTSEQTGSCATAESAMDANHGACVPPHVETSPVVASATYDYDEVGNRRNTLRGDVVEPGNRLAVFDDYHFTYDDEGNLTRKWKGTDDLRLSWNSLGQLDSVWRYQTGTVRYGYDASGRRVRRTAPNGTVTRYLYTGDDLTMELDAAGQPIRVYTYYPGVDRPHSVWVAATQQNYYYATDNPGHVEGLISSTNQLVNEYHYTPWGEPEAVTQTVEQPLRYMAREYDEVTGLYQVRARWYDPQQGRFVSEDPIGLAGGLNPYAYAGNNPINATDPFGLCEEWHTIETTTYPDGHVTSRIVRVYYKGDDCPGGGGGSGGGSGRSDGSEEEKAAEERCMSQWMPENASLGRVDFLSLSGTFALGVGGSYARGFYRTKGGDFGWFSTKGAAAGIDVSVDGHAGMASSMDAFSGTGYNVCGGSGVVSACVGGNSSGVVVSGGLAGGVPTSGTAGVTFTEPHSWRESIARWICK